VTADAAQAVEFDSAEIRNDDVGFAGVRAERQSETEQEGQGQESDGYNFHCYVPGIWESPATKPTHFLLKTSAALFAWAAPGK
jgi:hypothetical protein